MAAKSVVDFTRWTDKELAKIERDAYEVLRAKAKGRKQVKVELPEEVKKYARNVAAYRKRTGKWRLSKEEKRALHEFTPAQVQKRFSDGFERRYKNRQRGFEKKYGKNYAEKYGGREDIEAIKNRLLEFVGPARAAYVLGIEKDEPETPQEPEWQMFSDVKLKPANWSDFPAEFRNSNIWPHDGDSFIYNNVDKFFPEPVDIEALSRSANGGYDHEPRDFWEDIFPAVAGDILYDPGESGEDFFVYESEWNNVDRLADDYITSRRYIPKR